MLPASSTRVPRHTRPEINAEIMRETEGNILRYSSGGREEMDRRLRELEYEWDIERALEFNAALFSLAGILMGFVGGKKWLLFPAAVAGFLLQHAVQGWCPPVEVFRRLGLRTRKEIEYERYGLKALRGDFDELPKAREDYRSEVQRVIEAERK